METQKITKKSSFLSVTSLLINKRMLINARKHHSSFLLFCFVFPLNFSKQIAADHHYVGVEKSIPEIQEISGKQSLKVPTSTITHIWSPPAPKVHWVQCAPTRHKMESGCRKMPKNKPFDCPFQQQKGEKRKLKWIDPCECAQMGDACKCGPSEQKSNALVIFSRKMSKK